MHACMHGDPCRREMHRPRRVGMVGRQQAFAGRIAANRCYSIASPRLHRRRAAAHRQPGPGEHAHVHHHWPPREVQEQVTALGVALGAWRESCRAGGAAGVGGGSCRTRGCGGVGRGGRGYGGRCGVVDAEALQRCGQTRQGRRVIDHLRPDRVGIRCRREPPP